MAALLNGLKRVNWLIMKSINAWQKAFVLHTRAYSETSLLVDLFLEQKGKVTVLAKGARRKKSNQKGYLQPFVPILVQYSGNGNVKTLTKLEALSLAIPLMGTSLYSAFYLNELLYRILFPEIESETLFSAYLISLKKLAKNVNNESVLRDFELTLLTFLGYHIDFFHCGLTGENIVKAATYEYQYETGFVANALETNYSFTGEQVLALANKEFVDKNLRQAAKRFTRIALKPYVGNKPFKSKELFLKP